MNLEKAIAHIYSDEVLRPVIDTVGPIALHYSDDVYLHLIRAITSQQLSVRVAEVIYGRLLDLFPKRYPTASRLIQTDHEELRKIGLSNQKARYVKNVADYFIQNELLKAEWQKYSDEEIIDLLTEIKGVGKWTVQMILISALQRLDVFPVDDLGIQQGIKSLYELNAEKKELKAEISAIAEHWRPYRTVASIYVWRSKD